MLKDKKKLSMNLETIAAPALRYIAILMKNENIEAFDFEKCFFAKMIMAL